MPQTFTDGQNVVRTIALTIGAVDTVLAATGIDLYSPTEPTDDPAKPRSLVGRFHYEPRLIASVVALLVTPTVEDVAAWQRQQTAKSLAAARAAFLQEWEDFFRELGRLELAEILIAEVAFVQELKRLAIEEVNRTDIKTTAAQQLQKAKAEQTSAKPSGSLPVSSASTPAPSPSAS